MHVYGDEGEIIVHKISTPLTPKLNGLKQINHNDNIFFFGGITHPICPFRVELIHSTNRRRQSSKL
jgi:hypothetical protein